MVFSVRLGGCFKSCCLPGPVSRATTTTIAALDRKVVVVACWLPRRCAREAAVCVCVSPSPQLVTKIPGMWSFISRVF